MSNLNEVTKSSVERPRSDLTFDFDKLLVGVRRHLRAFLIVFIVVAAVIAGYTMTRPVRYQSTATLLINEHTSDVLHLNNVTPQGTIVEPEDTATSTAVDTQVEVLRSRTMASSVVDQLNLEQDPDFNTTLRPRSGPLGRLKALLGEGSTASSQVADTPDVKARLHESVVNALMRTLLIKRVGLTYTVDVTATAATPDKAALISNAVAQRYLTAGADSRIDETETATSWLDERLKKMRADVQSADAAVQQFKIQNNLMSAQGATLNEQQISTLDTDLAQARTQDAEQQARLKTAERQLAAGSNGGDVGEAMNNAVVQNLRAQRALASAQLADLQARYGDKYADVIKAKQALADIDAQISAEIARTISSLKAQTEISRTRVVSIAKNAAQSRSTLVGNNVAQVRLDELQRNDDAAREIYEAFLTRYKEALAKEGDLPVTAKMISTAKPPTGPSSPNPRLDAVLAVGGGLVAGAIAMVVADLLNAGLSNAAEVEEVFDLPALGEIPLLASTLPLAKRKNRPDPLDYVVKYPLSRFAESFRNLRSSIANSKVGHRVQVVALTSSLPNEGKTTTAIALARTAATGMAKVVLVDCDLRQRSVGRVLGLNPNEGLIEVLNGLATLDQALVSDQHTDLKILPLATSAFTPKDTFGGDAMRDLLGELRKRFDIIYLDTAPVLAVVDTRDLAPLADVVVVLTRWRNTTRQAVAMTLRALTGNDIFVAGIALTQVDVREQARAGEGAAHYYRAYQKYYVG